MPSYLLAPLTIDEDDNDKDHTTPNNLIFTPSLSLRFHRVSIFLSGGGCPGLARQGERHSHTYTERDTSNVNRSRPFYVEEGE